MFCLSMHEKNRDAHVCLISFGYDTGQISGFLEMPDFLDRFGQRHSDGTAYFSNVRAGLIVSLVCVDIDLGSADP